MQGKKPPAHICSRAMHTTTSLGCTPFPLTSSPLSPPPLQDFQLLRFQPSMFYINTVTSFPECRDRKVWNELLRAEPLKTLAESSSVHMLAIWQYVLWLNSILAKRGKGLLSLAFQRMERRRKSQHTLKWESSL